MHMDGGVTGFKTPSEKWRQMKIIYDACDNVGIEAPKEVNEFFKWEAPHPHGEKVDLGPKAVFPYELEMEDGYDIYVAALPKDVEVIRFSVRY